MIDRFNNQLANYGQLIRVTYYSSNSVTLSSGLCLFGNDKTKFCKRLMNGKTNIWASNIDKLLAGTVTEKEIRSELASIGGKAVQKKHSKTIKLNLNTGTPWNAGTKGQNIGALGPRPQSVKDAIGRANSGPGNGMYGIRMSDSDKQVKSSMMKVKILAGEFTPNSNNRNTHWDSKLDGNAYRSSWEALYQFINQTAEYETLRIEYKLEGSTKIYIVDFVDHINYQVIEVKPRELCSGEKFKAKIAALQQWANKNNYSLLIADKEWLSRQSIPIDYNRFDTNTARKIKALYEINKKN